MMALRKLGGNIRFSSDPDRGTTFTVELPAVVRPDEQKGARVA